MKIGITQRIFLSILTATSLAVFCIFLVMHWSINRGFMNYLDQGVQEKLAGRLARAYAGHGSWDFLRNKPRRRIFRLMAVHPDAALPPGPPDMARMVPDRGRMVFMRGRFILLDAARNPVAGNPLMAGKADFRPVVYAGKTVGYLGFAPRAHFLGPLQREFLKRQRLALVLAAVGMVLVVFIFSIPLAKRMVRPVRAMARAARELASGGYSVRIPVSSSDELGQLAGDFNEMAMALEKNEEARRQWVADISHELRTPLSVLRGETEALLEGVRETTPEAIGSLHAEVVRLNRLVDDLYQLSLSDLGALAYRKEYLDPAGVLREAVESYRPKFAGKPVELVLDIENGPDFTLFADEERLYQLFGNLLDNSLKYTDAGGKLAVRLSLYPISPGGGGGIAVEFEDTAPGVPEGELARLFDRLYRVEGSRNRASGGAGLGLSICRNIAQAHSGAISAHPSSMGGVLVRVVLQITAGGDSA